MCPTAFHIERKLGYMKITTGVDIIEVDRIKNAIEDLGNNFLNRIYTKREIDYCNKAEMLKYQRYAAGFAAKEAVFKAISEFINGREDALWKEIEMISSFGEKPVINVEKIKDKMKKTADSLELKQIDISISHIKDYAVASVVAVFE